MKKAIALFINRPVTSLMILLALCLLGIISVTRLAVGLMPNLQSPGITVVTRYSGVAATKIEELLTIPLERQVSDIPGMEKMLSVSSDGESKINLIFDYQSDIKVKILEANERINIIRDSFPREVEEPYIIRYDPTDRPVFIVSFSSPRYGLKQLREIVDRRIKPLYERIDGVSEVFVGGGYEREIQVLADPQMLVAYGIDGSLVARHVAAGNTFLPGGRFGGSEVRQVYTRAKYRDIGEIGDSLLTVDEKGGRVRLSRIARVIDGHRDRTTIARTNGEDRVTVYVQKAGSANTLGLTEECRRITDRLKLNDIKAHIAYNQGRFIRRAIDRVTGACVFGGLIAVFVLYAFLRRAAMTLVIGLTIPCSILTTFFLMYLSGIEINVMSLSGLALGAGMLIDNSIVVSESIAGHLQRDRGNPFRAILDGTSAVPAEIISATLTTIVVFIPLLYTGEETRLLYQGLTLTVVYSLLVSLVFSLTLLPAFLYFLIRRFEDRPAPVWQTVLIRLKVRALFRRMAGRYSIEMLKERYRNACRPLFRNYRKALLVPLLLFLLTPFVYDASKKEYSGSLDSDSLNASVDMETGTHLDRTREIVERAEKIIAAHPDVEEVNSKIEKWHASLTIRLKSSAVADAARIREELKKRTESIKEAFIYFSSAAEGAGNRELTLEFYGDDLAILKSFARQTAARIKKNVPGVVQTVLRFREPRGDLIVRPDRTKTALPGAEVRQIGQAVRNLLSGMIVTKFYDHDREVDVRFRAPEESLSTPRKLKDLRVPLQGGSLALRSIASFSEGEGETRIWRKNKRKSVAITVNYRDRSLNRVAEDIERLMKSQTFPKDVIYSFGDEFRKFYESQRQMLVAIFLSLVIIYLLLGALFESFLQPLLILITVPLSVCGVLFFLLAIDMPLTMSVYIGFIMLGGIVVNNSILVISTINRRLTTTAEEKALAKTEEKAGEQYEAMDDSLIDEVLNAAAGRLRPILMTTITTVLGMAPMIFDFSEGSGLFRPLALTVSTGLTFSLGISLIIVPLVSYLYHRGARRVRTRLVAGQNKIFSDNTISEEVVCGLQS